MAPPEVKLNSVVQGFEHDAGKATRTPLPDPTYTTPLATAGRTQLSYPGCGATHSGEHVDPPVPQVVEKAST